MAQQFMGSKTFRMKQLPYKSENPRLRAKLMGVIPRLVTDEENERFISMPEESEIKKSSQCPIQKHRDLI